MTAAAISLHAAVCLLLVLQFDYWDMFSVRHVMILAGLTLPFSAAGIVAGLKAASEYPFRRRVGKTAGAAEPGSSPAAPVRSREAGCDESAGVGGGDHQGDAQAGMKIGPQTRRRDEPHGRWAMVLVLIVLVTPTLPWLLETRYVDDAYLRHAGEWIRTHGQRGGRIMTTRHRVVFYAQGQWVRSPENADIGAILGTARAMLPEWIVFDERRMLRMSKSFFQDLHRALAPGEALETAFNVEGRAGEHAERAIVYRYRPPA